MVITVVTILKILPATGPPHRCTGGIAKISPNLYVYFERTIERVIDNISVSK